MGACICKSPPDPEATEEDAHLTEDGGKSESQIRVIKSGSSSKVSKTKIKDAKPKYYIQIVTVYERQKKENGEYVDMDPKYYKSWNDDSCTLDTNVNELIEPFDDVMGDWHWVEEKWSVTDDYIKHSKQKHVRHKVHTRVAVFERDYGCNNFIQEQIIDFLRKFIWHAKFFNSQEKTKEYGDYASDASESDDLDTKTVRTRSLIESEKNRSKSVLSSMSKNVTEDINNPMSNPRCIPYKTFLSQLHNLARKMYEYNENPDLLMRKSMANIDFQFSSATQNAMNQEMEDLDSPMDDEMKSGSNNNDNNNNNKKKQTMVSNGSESESEMRGDTSDAYKVTITGATDGITPNVSNKNTIDMANEHVNLNQVLNGSTNDDDNMQGDQDAPPQPSPFGLLGVETASRLGSLDGIVDKEQDLLACQNTFDKLSQQMRQAAFRVTKYSRDSMKNLELFLRDFIERHLKLLVSSTVPPNVKELLLFKCLLDVADINEEANGAAALNGSARQSPFDRLLQLNDSYLEAHTQLQKDALYTLDIFTLLDTLLTRIESIYKGKSLKSNSNIGGGIDKDESKDEYDDGDKIENEDDDDEDDDDENGGKISKQATIEMDDRGSSDDEKVDPEIERVMHARYASGVLGVSTQDDHPFNNDEIEASGYVKKYRDLMRKIHPDRNPNAKARDAFERVQEAYDYLKDGKDFDFMKEELHKSGTIHQNTEEYSQSSRLTDVGTTPNDAGHIHKVHPRFGGNSRLKQSSNNRLSGVSEKMKPELQVVKTICNKLKSWLNDSHASDPKTVATVMDYYRRLRLIEQCVATDHKLEDTVVTEMAQPIEENLSAFMTKSITRDYRRISRRIGIYKEKKEKLHGSLAQDEYNRYWNDVQVSVNDCISHMIAGSEKGLFSSMPKKPMTKIIKLFYNDNAKMLPKLDSNVKSLRENASKSPFAKDSIFVLKKMSDFIVSTNKALKDDNFEKEIEFRVGLQEITTFLENQLSDRFSLWVNCAIADIAVIIWKILDKNPKSGSSNNKDEKKENNMSAESVQAAMVDSFTFIHHLIESFFSLLISLPQPELKASCTKYFPKFFRGMLRVCLTFLNEMRPRFEWEEQQYVEYFKKHSKRGNIFGNKKKSKPKKKKGKDDNETKMDGNMLSPYGGDAMAGSDDDGGYSDNDDASSVQSGIIFEKNEMYNRVKNELLLLGYNLASIENGMRYRGSENIHAVLDYLLMQEKDVYASGNFERIIMQFEESKSNNLNDNSNVVGSATNVIQSNNGAESGHAMIFGRKGKISDEEYGFVCIMLAQMDAVMMEISKMDQTFSLKISQCSDFVQPKMQEMADYFVDTMEIWCEAWVNKSISLLSKHLFLTEFKMKENMYKSSIEPNNKDMETLLSNLHNYVDIFQKSLREELHQKIMDTLCKQFFNVLLWVLLDPRSQRKYYRSWIINEKTVDCEQLHYASKFEQDLDICKNVFVNDFGISENDFDENVKQLNECFELMHLTTAQLIYKHQKRGTRKMIGAPLTSKQQSVGTSLGGSSVGGQSVRTQEIPIAKENIIENEGLDDMLFSVIMHRQKSYADGYVRDYLSGFDSKSLAATPAAAASTKANTPLSTAASTKAKNLIGHGREWPIKKDMKAIENDRPLFVEVIGGKNLRNKRKFGGISDCQAELSCLDQKYSSKVLSSNLNPRWKDEGFIFLIPKNYFDTNNVLELEIHYNDKKHFLGMYKFQISRSNPINETKNVKFAGKGNNLLTEKDYGEMIIHINASALFQDSAHYNFG